jgi:hypothetical protein
MEWGHEMMDVNHFTVNARRKLQSCLFVTRNVCLESAGIIYPAVGKPCYHPLGFASTRSPACLPEKSGIFSMIIQSADTISADAATCFRASPTSSQGRGTTAVYRFLAAG